MYAKSAQSPDRRTEPVRIVTAAALFDGHDVSINIMRRLLQAQGAEVIHLGHDRSVGDVVTAAVQEDADAVAISSYQGGHVEFFRFLLDELRACGAGHVRVYGGGGGVIVPEEIEALQAYGVARIFSPEDGRQLGLEGMIRTILAECRPRPVDVDRELGRLAVDAPLAISRVISWLEGAGDADDSERVRVRAALAERAESARVPVVGFTGTGGAGKSSLVDEIVRRFRREFPGGSIGILSVDPTRRRSGGALLGDRIRMNAIQAPHVFVRSLATRQAHLALSRAVADAALALRAAGFDWVVLETAGIGQSDSEVVDLVDASVYVMTPEYGAPSQLEKIDMLDLADLVVLNKFDRRGGADALRDVRKQWQRNHREREGEEGRVPVYATIASRFCDPGVDRVYEALTDRIARLGFELFPRRVLAAADPPGRTPLIPGSRSRYLSDIAETVRDFRAASDQNAEHADDAWALQRVLASRGDVLPEGLAPYPETAIADAAVDEPIRALRRSYNEALAALDPDLRAQLAGWPETRAAYAALRQSYRVREREIEVANSVETLSGSRIPRVALPRAESWGELSRFLQLENLPGRFPFTAGVFPFKQTGEEDPTRMFAGEGGPERTNRRFHLLCRGQPARRLSTAFDSVTLYGRDPGERPDVYGKVGTSGVSVCTLDDAKKLYSGFDLCDPRTSVSMTINGPAPIILAFYLNAAIDQAVERSLAEQGGEALAGEALSPYDGPLPDGHDGLGLGLLGRTGDAVVDPETYARIRSEVLQRVRGTVQSDILKEDQAQNTCIFSTEFALRMMGDIQEYFSEERVRNFYSVSVSGYHMAEAGANPITQLAFTLANGFTLVEYYLARGLDVDAFVPNFSFFFSNGLDPEYSVIGRVARRIWALAMRERYGAGERSQKLKYHVQTSGRSLHAQEMSFNDVRTTLQALTALQDHCNSLHTNAYDEAVTTPTEESARRALAIQLILNREFGPLRNENPIQGAYLTDALTDLVETAVLAEFDRLSDRGGVLGAMETMYQRGRIQDESMVYEARKHSGELPIVGVNTFLNPAPDAPVERPTALQRATDPEKHAQLANLHAFRAHHAADAPGALERLQQVALEGGNVFRELMETVKVCSLGQISEALFEVGGQYRRAM